MNTLLLVGSIVVFLALTSYSIAIITEQIKRKISNRVLIFLTLGISLDIIATLCMIIGSPNSPFTIHGFIGYSALAVMLIDAIAIWNFKLKNDNEAVVGKKLHLYSLFAYLWWVVAFITGAVLAIVY